MSRLKNFRQSNWLIELSLQKNVKHGIVGMRSTFHGSTFFRLGEIPLKANFHSVIFSDWTRNLFHVQTDSLKHVIVLFWKYKTQFKIHARILEGNRESLKVNCCICFPETMTNISN